MANTSPAANKGRPLASTRLVNADDAGAGAPAPASRAWDVATASNDAMGLLLSRRPSMMTSVVATASLADPSGITRFDSVDVSIAPVESAGKTWTNPPSAETSVWVASSR